MNFASYEPKVVQGLTNIHGNKVTGDPASKAHQYLI